MLQVAIRSCCLGLACSIGISLSLSSWPCQLLGWYLTALAVFHWSEYFFTAVTNPRHLALDSYILDHSQAYHIAVVSSFIEFGIEYYFFPGSLDFNDYWLKDIFSIMFIIIIIMYCTSGSKIHWLTALLYALLTYLTYLLGVDIKFALLTRHEHNMAVAAVWFI